MYQDIRNFVQNMKKENLSTFASSAAFYIFLALVPILIVICSIIPYTPLTKANLLGFILEIVPRRLEGIVKNIIDDVYQRSAGVLSVAVLVTLWSAGKGIMAVVRGLNEVNGVKEHRNYFLLRIISSFYTIILLLVIITSMIILVFGNSFLNLLMFRLPKLEVLFSAFVNCRFIVGWILLTLLFSAFYAYLPDKKLKLRYQLPGASFAAMIWNIFSWGFSIYVDYFKAFHTYGNLSIIVIFMIWLYICIYIMFMGAYLNKCMKANDL